MPRRDALLQSMSERHKADGLHVVGFSVDRGDPNNVRAFVQSRGVSYPIAIVSRDVEAAFGGVRGYPTSFPARPYWRHSARRDRSARTSDVGAGRAPTTSRAPSADPASADSVSR
ncbi:MAG: TlpA disulfide reductase family protein [Gemmatimonadaceae bacterium]